MPKAKSSVEIKNRRASFDYEFIETFQAGIVLTGTEIKSIRAGKASLVDFISVPVSTIPAWKVSMNS